MLHTNRMNMWSKTKVHWSVKSKESVYTFGFWSVLVPMMFRVTFILCTILYRKAPKCHVASQFLFRSFILITRLPFVLWLLFAIDMVVKRAHQFCLCAGRSLATLALPRLGQRPTETIKKLNKRSWKGS